MWEWIRGLPSPDYGRCGGADRDCSDKPITDPMDLAFREHDQNCYQASLLPPDEVEKAKSEADHILHEELEKIDPKTLGIYGRLYRLACLVIFR